MKNLTLGIDISHWQTNSAENPQYFFDPSIAVGKGVQFAIIRAADPAIEGKKDRAFDTFAQSFANAGIPYGCYFYGRPASTKYGSALQQADYFWSLIKDKPFTFPPVLDLECTEVVQGNMTGLSYAKAFLERIAELSGMKPIIYTSPGFWMSLRDSNNATWAAEYPLWLAHYFSSLEYPQYDIPDNVINSTTLPTVPDPWKKKGKTWSIWQYCATGDGEFYGGDYAKHTDNVGLDLDVFNGTLDEMLEKLGAKDVSDPDDPHDDDPIELPTYVRVIAKKNDGSPGWLFFRNKPELYEDAQLAIGYGDELELIDSEKIHGDIDYWHVKTNGGREGYISAGSSFSQII